MPLIGPPQWVDQSSFSSLAVTAAGDPTGYDGYEVFYQGLSGVRTYMWHLRFDKNINDGYPWVFVGGNPLFAVTNASSTRNNISWGNLDDGPNLPAVIAPRPGYYILHLGANVKITGGDGKEYAFVGPQYVAGVDPSENDAAQGQGTALSGGDRNKVSVAKMAGQKLVTAANTTINLRYRNSQSGCLATYDERWLQVMPARLG